jgi:GH25 family lysozyme M1 (1,4-beta-N-acetylmuramidase)
MIYTGSWFINQNGKLEHVTYLDNINKVKKQRPMWYAGYPVGLTKQYGNLKTAVEEIEPPDAKYIGAILQCGSYSLADLWQFTDRLKITGDDQGVDASVTMGTLAEYWAAVGVTATAPEPEPGTPPAQDSDTAARLTALEDAVAAIKARMDKHIAA